MFRPITGPNMDWAVQTELPETTGLFFCWSDHHSITLIVTC